MAYKHEEDRKRHDRERHAKYMAEYRKRKGEGYRTRYRIGQLRRQYGLTEADYDGMIQRQNNECAACGEPMTDRGPTTVSKICVDHDHATNKVRGLLCGACNRAIGHAKENPARLRSCASYLERHQ